MSIFVSALLARGGLGKPSVPDKLWHLADTGGLALC